MLRHFHLFVAKFVIFSSWITFITLNIGVLQIRLEMLGVVAFALSHLLYSKSRIKFYRSARRILEFFYIYSIAITIFLVNNWQLGVWIGLLYWFGLIILMVLPNDFDSISILLHFHLRCSILFGICNIVLWIALFFTSIFSFAGNLQTFSGLSREPNLLGSQALLSLILLSSRFYMKTKFLFLAQFLMCFCILLSNTRAVWIATLIFILLYGRKRILLISYSVSLFTLMTLLYREVIVQSAESNSDSIFYSIVHILDTGSGTGAYRAQILIDGAHELLSNIPLLLLGHGFASFPEYFPVDPVGNSGTYMFSGFFGLLFEVGLVGLIIMSLYFRFCFEKVYYRREIYVFLIALFIVSSTTSPLWLVYPWLYFALIMRANKWKHHFKTDSIEDS